MINHEKLMVVEAKIRAIHGILQLARFVENKTIEDEYLIELEKANHELRDTERALDEKR